MQAACSYSKACPASNTCFIVRDCPGLSYAGKRRDSSARGAPFQTSGKANNQGDPAIRYWAGQLISFLLVCSCELERRQALGPVVLATQESLPHVPSVCP